MNEDRMKTLNDLQKPTMSLISSFYQMPADIKELFVDMLSIYEANPTEETAKLLSDKIMSRDTSEVKKEWIKTQSLTVSPEKRQAAEEKYLKHRHSVPKGVPSSGMFMAGLDLLNREDKNALMDAQAAARILGAIQNPKPFIHQDLPKKDADEIQAEDFKAAYGEVLNAPVFLDNNFASEAQRMEDLTKLYIIQKHYYQSISAPHQPVNLFGWFQSYAIGVLTDVALRISDKRVSERIHDLAASYQDDDKIHAKQIYTHPFFNQTSERLTPIDERIKHRVSQLKQAECLRLSKLTRYQAGK